MIYTPLISIIVPVYNAEKYCRKCVDSLLSIKYFQKEIILVDDCSTDNSGLICDEYAEKYIETKVIHHEKNYGVTKARISGFKHAKGEYIMFVDSDDYVHPDILDKMIEPALLNQAEMVCCQICNLFGEHLEVEKRSIFGIFDKTGIKEIISNNLLHDDSLNKSGMPLYLCGKLYKREILTDSLQEGLNIKYEEDLITILFILAFKINKLVIIKESYYYYVHHESQVTSKKLWEIGPSRIQAWEKIDKMNVNDWSEQLTKRIWVALKPSIYDSLKDWGGFYNNKYIKTYSILRESEIVKKYIWGNKQLPKEIKNHPHFLLLKYKFYFLDFILYVLIWSLKKR